MSGPIRILHVQGDARRPWRVGALLRGSDPPMQVEVTGSLASAADRHATVGHDVVLLELGLPDGDGLVAVERTVGFAGRTPVVVLAGAADERLAVDALGLGADGWLAGDTLTAESLAAAVTRRLRRRSADRAVPVRRNATVALVGRRTLLLEGVAGGIDGAEGLRLTGNFNSVAQMADTLRRGRPDVVLIEAAGTDAGGEVELARRLLPRAKLVVLADSADRHVDLVLRREVDGVVLDHQTSRQVAGVLLQVVDGQVVLPAGWQPAVARADAGPVSRLSDRQREILRLVADGHSNDAIAQRLFISVNTVKFHLRSIYSQLGVKSRVGAVAVFHDHHPSG